MANKTLIRIINGIICFILLFDLVVKVTTTSSPKQCDPNNLTGSQCSQTQFCSDVSKTCECRPGYKFHNDTYCTAYVVRANAHSYPSAAPSSTDEHGRVAADIDKVSSGGAAVWVLVSLFLVVLVICGVYVGRRYKFVSWMRTKMNERNNNYDEFMIGQEDDDPPLR